jgi:hypothetical protein
MCLPRVVSLGDDTTRTVAGGQPPGDGVLPLAGWPGGHDRRWRPPGGPGRRHHGSQYTPTGRAKGRGTGVAGHQPATERTADGEPAGAASPAPGGGVPALVERARRGCGADLAVVGWRSGDDLVVAAAPAQAAAGATAAQLAETAGALVGLAWADPELDHAPVLLRTSMLAGPDGAPRRSPVALVPLRPAEPATGPEGLFCVVGPAGGTFTPDQLDRLVAVGRRLTSHRRARRVLGDGDADRAATGAAAVGAAGRLVDPDPADGAS